MGHSCAPAMNSPHDGDTPHEVAGTVARRQSGSIMTPRPALLSSASSYAVSSPAVAASDYCTIAQLCFAVNDFWSFSLLAHYKKNS